jgi:hypothetical protein
MMMMMMMMMLRVIGEIGISSGELGAAMLDYILSMTFVGDA